MLRLSKSAKVVPDCCGDENENEAEDLNEHVSSRIVEKKGYGHGNHVEVDGREEFVEIFVKDDKVKEHLSNNQQHPGDDVHDVPSIMTTSNKELLLFQITDPNTSELRCSEPETWQLIFIGSSTFTDTQIERDILMKEIVPILREKARPYGIDVVDVDMRWGVKDENTDHHMTWLACSQIIERCRLSSKGVFFVSLQSLK
jgi:hypothetical protein